MPNPAIPEISGKDWIARLKAASPRPLHFDATVELTERCNLRCLHCYIALPADHGESLRRELDTSQWRNIIDQMADAGVIWVTVTGGEPLLRRDFLDIYLYAKRRGLQVILFTNGTLLTPAIADVLAEYPPYKVEITLYGATPAVYERVTGVPGAYDRCLRGVDLLLERDLWLELKMTVSRINVSELSSVAQIAAERGVRFRYDPLLFSRIDGDHRPLAYRLSPEEIVALAQGDALRLGDWERFCSSAVDALDQDHLFICGAGLRSFHIDSYGGLFPCILSRWLRYDLLSGSLDDAFSSFLPSVRALRLTHRSPCRTCELLTLCQICPAWSLRECGDPEAPDPFRCRLARLKYKVVRGVDVAQSCKKQQSSLGEVRNER